MAKKFLKCQWVAGLSLLMAACSSKQQEHSNMNAQQACGFYTPVPQSSKRDYSQMDPRYKVGKPYQIKGRWYYPCENFDYEEVGVASWYGPGFHGKKTANGERYNMHGMTAAHRTLPLPSMIEVTNLANGRKAVLKVTDRGPYAKDRIIDISKAGAKHLGFIGNGTAQVRVRILKEESLKLAGLSSRNAKGFDIGSRGRQQGEALDRFEENTFPWQQPVQLAEVFDKDDDLRIEKDLGFLTIPQKNGILKKETSGKNQYSGLSSSTPLTQPVKVAPVVQLASLKQERFTPVDQGGTPITSTKPFFVQAGAFSSYQNAHAYSVKLSSLAESFIVNAHVNNKMIYRVRLGPLKTSLEANQLLGKMHSQGYTDARIVTDSL